AKLLNNMVKDINQLGVLETFVLGAKQGLDCGLLFHVMRKGASVSRQLERILPKILDRSFEQTSYVSTNIKDQGLMEWMIGQAGLELPLRNAARDSWMYAAEQGLADADPPEAIKALEPIAGIEVAGELLPSDADVPPHGGAYDALDRMTAAMYEVGVFEAFALTTKLGMDAQAMYEVMRTASGASARLERIGRVILGGASGDPEPSVNDYVSCYEPLLAEARRDGLRMPLHEASASLWRRAGGQGLGSGPSSAAYALYA
ncbi:MAG: NAD-binding protein, partial [Chloroflexi bacterium]|nr:NAD-binding protein [Chloroflexota bacterium]